MKAIIRLLVVLVLALGTVPVALACEGVEGCDCDQAQATTEAGAEVEAHDCTGNCGDCPYAQTAVPAATDSEPAATAQGCPHAQLVQQAAGAQDCPHAQLVQQAAEAHDCTGDCADCPHAQAATDTEPAAEAQDCAGNCGSNCSHHHGGHHSAE